MLNNRVVIWVLLLVGCSENTFTQVTKIDVFQQQRKNTVDVLLVVDNSCSMIEEQKKLASNFDSFIQYFDGADVDWRLGVVTTDMEQDKFSGKLVGGDDEIVLVNAAGTEVDRVAYDETWEVPGGMSYSLDPTYFSSTDNDSVGDWCQVDPGTPGTANASCGIEPGSGENPDLGEVIITEFMADPTAVADEFGEWVEITNISAEDVDLSGWMVEDDGRNSFVVPEGTTIAAGAALVLGRSADTAVNGGVAVNVELGEAFGLNNNLLWLDAQTEGPSEIFGEMVAQGTSGSGIEMGLEGARRALIDPVLTAEPDGHNYGFIRDEANLSILIVSDEQDSSGEPVDDYLTDLAMVKGEAAFRDHSIMNVSAVVGDQPPEFDGEPSCTSANGNAAYGSRYVYAVYQTGGLVDSICDEDFSPLVSQLGLTLSGLLAEWSLSAYPDLDTLQVGLYATNDETSKIRDLTLDVDYTYVDERNSIRFELEQVPESEQYIQAEYKVRSGQ